MYSTFERRLIQHLLSSLSITFFFFIAFQYICLLLAFKLFWLFPTKKKKDLFAISVYFLFRLYLPRSHLSAFVFLDVVLVLLARNRLRSTLVRKQNDRSSSYFALEGECVPPIQNRRLDYSRPPPHCVSSSASSSRHHRRSYAKKKSQNAIPQMEIFRSMIFLAIRLPEPVVSPSAAVEASLVYRTRCAC